MTATITAPLSTIRQAAARLVDTAPLRSPQPVLRNVRLYCDGAVSLSSTDTERSHVENITSSCEHSGRVDALVDARLFRSLFTKLTGKTVTVEIDGSRITVGTRSVDIADESPDDLPDCRPVSDPECGVSMPASDLRRMLERTMFACDSESSPYELGAILIEMDRSGYCRFVATDGRRLATDYVGAHSEGLITALWPVNAAKKALKAVRRAARCTLTINGNYIGLACYHADGTISSWDFRQIVGRFPKWRDVIPQYPMVCDVSADALASLSGDVVALAKHSDEDGAFAASYCSDADILSVSGSHVGCFGAIECESAYNPLDDVRLDARYICEFATACKGDTITIRAFNKHDDRRNDKQFDHAVHFECGSADYVVMPLSR